MPLNAGAQNGNRKELLWMVAQAVKGDKGRNGIKKAPADMTALSLLSIQRKIVST